MVFFCNFSAHPINTPPSLSVTSPVPVEPLTPTSIPHQVSDAQSGVTILIKIPPMSGTAFYSSNNLRYSPSIAQFCLDNMTVVAWDGVYESPPVTVILDETTEDDWQTIHDDILWPNCRNCHLNGNVEGGLSLETYSSALAGGNSGPITVVPNFPASSLLYTNLAGCTMPKGEPCLPNEIINRVFNWISRGALEEDACE